MSVGGVDGGFGSSSRRKAGPDSQQEACNSDTDTGRVPMSAGLSLVGMYCHCSGLDIFLMVLMRFTMYRFGASLVESFFTQASTSWLSE